MAIVPKREQGITEPGIYAFEITACEERISQKGDAFFAARLAATDFGSKLICFDNIMLAGQGAGIGAAKLFALGFQQEGANVEAAELIGKRGFVAVKVEEYEGVKRLKVDIGARASECCGYWPESDEPKPVMRPGGEDYGF